MSASECRLYWFFECITPVVARISVVVGVLVLLGWLFDLDALKNALMGLTAIKANTATGFILSGVSLWGIQKGSLGISLRGVSQSCASVVLLLGLLTIWEYASGVDFGIDQLLIQDATQIPGDIPGRMSVNSALSFSVLGATLLLVSQGKDSMTTAIHALALVPIVVAGAALIGYVYDIEKFAWGAFNYTPMKRNTAVVFVLLVLGIVNARSDYPIRRVMASDSAVGVTVRHLLPAAIGFTIVTGWLIQQGYHSGYFSEPMVPALFTAASIAGLSALILWNAGIFYKASAQRERAEEARSNASQYARSLIEASLDPLVTISPEGKITDVNEGSIKVTGMRREELIGTDFSDYFTEPEKAREGYQQVFAKGFVTDYPLTIRHRDGKFTEVLYNASVYKDVPGNVLGVFASARDVTESKRIMREFIETKNFLDNILQSSTKYSIIGKDLKHSIVSWNEGAKRNYGYRAEEILGKNSNILHTPEDIGSGAVEKLMATAYENGLAEGEFERIRKDGSRFMANVVVTRRNDASGNPIGYLLMSNDISEKKQADEQLRFASQYARSLIEASLDPLVTISPEGKITDVNEGSIKVTGMRREELIGTDFSDYFTEPEKAREGYQQVFAKGFVTDYPLTIRHRDGKLTEVLYNASVYKDVQGNVLGVFAAARDVTVQKQVEEELMLARNAAEAANQAKSVFLANMSHELRTPLNAILGFSNMMRKDPRQQESNRQNLDIINRSGEHLLTLINDVLEMAKIEAGRVQLENAPFDLGAMVRDVTDMMQIRAQDKGLLLLIDQNSRFPRYIAGDEARLRQVLINLIGNAVKHTQQGGVTLRLGTKQNKISHLQIEVEDSGSGISREDQKRIFEPFVQLSEQGDSKGTGLGLTLTRQFVQMMGGNISLESTPGNGSLFRVDLPLNEVMEADIVKPKEAEKREVIGLAPGQSEYRILIVEDQYDNQLLLTKLMESVGFQVKVAENGKIGVALFQSWHPHLIWMDRRMPVMDGMEATRRIRELPGGKAVKIIAVTASAFIEQRAEMLAVGMDDFVRKPYRSNEIYESLSKQLGVRYIYEGAPEPEQSALELTPEMLSVLPEGLRIDFANALESLETESIELIIQQVATYDRQLQKTLTFLAENFDYSTILKVLREPNDK